MLSIATVVTIVTGSAILRMLSSYRPTSTVILRIGEPSTDISYFDGNRFVFVVSISVLNMGTTQIPIDTGTTTVVFMGTSGYYKIQRCPIHYETSYGAVTLYPGSTTPLKFVCLLTLSDVTTLFGSSWNSDIIKQNTRYLFAVLYYKDSGVERTCLVA